MLDKVIYLHVERTEYIQLDQLVCSASVFVAPAILFSGYTLNHACVPPYGLLYANIRRSGHSRLWQLATAIDIFPLR